MSEGWTKELTFFQIVAAGSVAERVHDALHTSKARSAIFFCLPLERNLL
ncbi:hypothetical protein BSU04_13840 [Caballeronia sordidicola]|uniref:Uncharacterized protein n=1 Tax=Caballeronia sordidicola TaxID=196367 RepID=A0A226X3M2_CABSO|nr:hypothetical protein BSU04_13840 [Caballeronia sordidicola]